MTDRSAGEANADADATATSIALADAIDVYLERKALGDGDPETAGVGTYAAKAGSILGRFAEWLEHEFDVRAIADLSADHMRAYALELGERADRGEYTTSTVHTYYAVVRAFFSWCVRGGIVADNPAAADHAEAALPSAHSETGDNAQTDRWSAAQRRQLEAYVRTRSLDADRERLERDERRTRLREYAMVALLAHSPVRGSELFRVPEDDRRTGATWDDVDFYAGTIRVLGKSQRYEDVTLFGPARTPLRRYGVVLDPPSNDWPLFPTRHAPSIARQVRETLRQRGHDDDEIEALLEEHTATELARERAIAPPAITTEGARSVLKRLCSDAGLEVDGDYLTPRGVRSDRVTDDHRRESSGSKPMLRAALTERSIAVRHEDDSIVTVEPTDRSSSDET
ncbi:recombinase XerD [Natronolimnobius sp. AArcel1]|uniref:recombinase XerD n=1 Tax=Natronolimnobius sp. AArcel1 TaxID=1679093 RepID=UPI0013EBF382|nr:recombinase XerD [Natronolimnobius sp. AArcel1]